MALSKVDALDPATRKKRLKALAKAIVVTPKNVAWARQFGGAVELSSIIMLRQLSLLADHLPRCAAFGLGGISRT